MAVGWRVISNEWPFCISGHGLSCKALVSFYTDTEMFVFKERYRFNISTRKNLANYSKSVDKPSTSFVRTGCAKLSTSLKQLLTSLTVISDLLKGCANNSDTVPLLQDCHKVDNTRL